MANVTIQDIARAAGVSKSTVSRVLNGTALVASEKVEAVLQASERLEFRPNLMARSLASGQSMAIGVLTQLMGSPFYDTIAQGVIRGLRDTDYFPVFADGRWEHEGQLEGIRALVGRQVDGLLVIGGDASADELADITQGLPTVVVARRLNDDRFPCVWMDNEDGGYKATSHLVESGHREVALVRGRDDHPDTHERMAGYLRALEEHGIELNSELILEGDFSAESGFACGQTLLSMDEPSTAVFAMNDMMAFGVRLAAHQAGVSVPGDLSIIGFDDQKEAEFATPPLTTVRQPAREMGHAAATKLLQKIAGEAVAAEGVEAELICRDSVALLRGDRRADRI